MSELPLDQKQNGNLIPRSGRVVAQHSIQIDGVCSETEAINILSAVAMGFMLEVMSEDTFYFAMSNAKKTCVDAGMDENTVSVVLNRLYKMYQIRRKSNPLSGMF